MFARGTLTVRPPGFPSLRIKEVDYITACECGAWSLEIWKKKDPATRITVPFKCRSWRHEGDCRLWKGAQDFQRIKGTMDLLQNWTHVCLTYRQRDRTLSYRQFRDCLSCWSRLRKRIKRQFGWFKYICTWERHESGWPHAHVVIASKALLDACTDHPKVNFRTLLRGHAVASGFGPVGWCEGIATRAAMAGYLCKLARELTGRGKDYQIPTNAPRHFRRLRASVGLLIPPHKDPEMTGVLRYCAGEMPGDESAQDPKLPYEKEGDGMDAVPVSLIR